MMTNSFCKTRMVITIILSANVAFHVVAAIPVDAAVAEVTKLFISQTLARTKTQPTTKHPTRRPSTGRPSTIPTVPPTTASPTAAMDVGAIPTKEELWTIHKAKWDTFLATQSSRFGYEMVYQKDCFCIPDMIVPYRVSVNKDGVVTNIKHANNNGSYPAVNSIVAANMLTVERAFQVIQDAWSTASNAVTVTYDEEYGHPTYVYIDKSARIIDEEYSFTIRNVTHIG